MAYRKIIKDSEGGQKYVTEQEEELVFDQVPTKGSFNPVTSDAVAEALSVGEGGEQIGDVIPSGTSEQNKLVNENALRELMVNTIGGRTYKTTKIGNKIWLAENLDFKFYGLKIGNSAGTGEEPVAAYYNNDEATYGVTGNKYGLLYNWYAMDILNKYKDQLIPGWHVPTAAEWDALAAVVGGASVAGTKLKAKTGWFSWAAGTDDFGFTAVPAGQGDPSTFSNLNMYTWFWGSDKPNDHTCNCEISPGSSLTRGSNLGALKLVSIRLVRDA